MLKEKPDNRQVPFPYSHRERARPAPSHLTFAIIWMKPVLHQDLASRQCGFRNRKCNRGKTSAAKVPLLIISRCWITAFGNKGSEVGLDFSGVNWSMLVLAMPMVETPLFSGQRYCLPTKPGYDRPENVNPKTIHLFD